MPYSPRTHYNLREIGELLGLRERATRRELGRVAALFPPIPWGGGNRKVYDARVVDLIHAMHGRPHRSLEPAASNWLSRFLKENDDRTPPAP